MPSSPKLRPSLLSSLLLSAVLLLPERGLSEETAVFVADEKGKPVAGAVVAFKPAGKSAAVKPGVYEIVQEGQRFIPELTIVPVGSRIRFPNRDDVAHHVYSFSPAKKFDIPLYQGEAPQDVVFDRPGVVALGCNIHDWMLAHVFVVDTPYFAVTGNDGRAVLRAAPAGSGTLEVWHPRARADEVKFEVEAIAKTPPVALKLRPEFRRRHAPAAGGEDGSYR